MTHSKSAAGTHAGEESGRFASSILAPPRHHRHPILAAVAGILAAPFAPAADVSAHGDCSTRDYASITGGNVRGAATNCDHLEYHDNMVEAVVTLVSRITPGMFETRIGPRVSCDDSESVVYYDHDNWSLWENTYRIREDNRLSDGC